MNHTSNKIKNIVVAAIAVVMSCQMWKAAGEIGENVNLRVGFGTPLTTGMQAVFYLFIVVLAVMAFQNLLEFYVLQRYGGSSEIPERARKVIKFAIYVKIYASLAMRLVISLLFIVLACVAFFAPGVKERDGGIYGVGIFMLALAGFLIYANIRVAVARVRSLKGDTSDAENT
ncbi:MAG: hypothetical protein IJZ76_08225 [Lachnospiraceae bacterium]|nr:hypothetical protein [Lachnospiraceae bacterium]